MAQAIGCDLCQQEAAVMMQSNLTNGDTIGVGNACMVTFYAASLTTMLHDASPETLNAFSGVLEPLAAVIGPEGWLAQAEANQAEADSMAAEQSDRLDDPYEDGNTEYGIEQAQELNARLAGQ